MLTKLKTYRAALEDYQKMLQQAIHAVNPNAQQELFGDSHDFGGTGAEHRALFGAGQSEAQAIMEASNDLILQATRDTLEIEETAMHVMEDLSDQRSTMEKFRDRIQDINASLDRAGQLMQEMLKRLCGNKVLMAIVVVILFAGVVMVIWLRFFPPWEVASAGSNQTTTATARWQNHFPSLHQ